MEAKHEIAEQLSLSFAHAIMLIALQSTIGAKIKRTNTFFLATQLQSKPKKKDSIQRAKRERKMRGLALCGFVSTFRPKTINCRLSLSAARVDAKADRLRARAVCEAGLQTADCSHLLTVGNYGQFLKTRRATFERRVNSRALARRVVQKNTWRRVPCEQQQQRVWMRPSARHSRARM